MFRRITTLWLICIGLVLGGMPAMACCSAAPTKDCCPAGQPLPGQDHPTSAVALAVCCTAGVANAATVISAAETYNVPEQPQGPDPLALLTSLVLCAAVDTRLLADFGSRSATYKPSYSTLYLSSGRLRL